MIVSAHDVAAELRARLPDLGVKKLHKLLYYCQGHHLAFFEEPLFRETISAWRMGPVVGEVWYRERDGEAPPPPLALSEGQLNTVGYVVSRYGNLTARDLENLSHAEEPWLRANEDRRPDGSTRMPIESIRDYFRSERDDEEPLFDSAELTAWLAGAEERRRTSRPGRRDDLNEIRARLQAGRA